MEEGHIVALPAKKGLTKVMRINTLEKRCIAAPVVKRSLTNAMKRYTLEKRGIDAPVVTKRSWKKSRSTKN